MNTKDHMLEKIITSTEEEVKKIINSAETETKFQEKIVNNKIKKFKDNLKNEYDNKLKNKIQLIKSNYTSKTNKNKLKNREKIVSTIYDNIKNMFLNISQEDYKKFILNSIEKSIKILNEKNIIIDYNKKDEDFINNEIKNNFEKNITFEVNKNLISKGIIINNSDRKKYLIRTIENIIQENKNKIRFLIWQKLKNMDPELIAKIN